MHEPRSGSAGGTPQKPGRKCFDDEDADPSTEAVDEGDDLADRPGFDIRFLGIETPTPRFMPDIVADALLLNGSTELRYEHFSLAMSYKRRMARWVAWNIDGATLFREGKIPRRGFRQDRRVPAQRQITNYVYDKDNHLDRGHVSRRADLLWGTLEAATRANDDSFYYPNITPQMDVFNQSGQGGDWGCFENALYTQAMTGQRISVFGGPILEADDPGYEDIQVPVAFWKILLYVVDGAPRAKGFVLKQVVKYIDVEDVELPKWEPFAKTIAHISARTLLDFGVVRGWDRTKPSIEVEEVETPIRDIEQIDW